MILMLYCIYNNWGNLNELYWIHTIYHISTVKYMNVNVQYYYDIRINTVY